MAAQIIAAAAGPKVIESATDDQGLINQAFKLTILIALALAVGVGIFLIWRLTGVFAGVFDIIDSGLDLIETVLTVPQLAATVIITATPFGRGLRNFTRLFQ
jgi:hypothetical protein